MHSKFENDGKLSLVCQSASHQKTKALFFHHLIASFEQQTMDAMDETTPIKEVLRSGSSESPGEMAAEPPPRLMITKIVSSSTFSFVRCCQMTNTLSYSVLKELENFKSYAGVREIGPFHSNFSAVVGPNGSGKSNVIDAMLFVFGKRAKKLRLNKVSELIHNSDAVKDNPPTSARVSVYFQEIVDTGPDQYRVIPNTETVVTRIARKDNSSTYKIDGKNCQFKEVATYLDAKGIDLDNNRFLILQGEVEMISMMPPKGKTEHDEGLLEYLEDIIGSNKFVEETNIAAEKVEALTGQRSEKLNRVKAAEKEKDALESAKVEAEQLLGIEREIRRQKNILFQLNQLQVDREVAKFNEEKENVQNQIQALGEDLRASNDRIKEIESGLLEQRKEYEQIYDELTKTKEEFAAYERRDIKVREEIKHFKKQKKSLQAKISSETEKEASSVAKGKEAEKSIPEIEQAICDIKESKAVEDEKLEKIYDEIKGITQNLRTELDQKTQELAPILQEKATLQASLETAETEAKLLQDSAKRAKGRLEASEHELASLDEVQEQKRREKEECELVLQEARDRIVAAESEQATLKGQEEKLGAKVKRSMVSLQSVLRRLLQMNHTSTHCIILRLV
jgi:structural maintenance of chromosome 4